MATPSPLNDDLGFTEEPFDEGPPKKRRHLLLGVIAAASVLFVCIGLGVGWASGWLSHLFVDSLPPKMPVAEAIADGEAVRDEVLAALEARMQLESQASTDGEVQDGPSFSTEETVCQSDLRTTGFHARTLIAFTSHDQTPPEAIVIADEAIVSAGFTGDEENSVEQISTDLQTFLDGGSEGPPPASLNYRDDEGNRTVLRYDDLDRQLVISIAGPCYRRT